MQRTVLIGGAAVIGVAVLAIVLIVSANLLRGDEEPPPEADTILDRPDAGEVRADYLADGTPVFVVEHADGSVSVVSAFDTHVPHLLGKLNWWCADASGFENPSHGSHWDARGVKLGGPAPLGLPTWEATVAGRQVFVGARRPGWPLDTAPLAPAEPDRNWCQAPADPVLFHTFEDWRVWGSPTQALEEAGDEWILLEGELVAVPEDERVILCALDGCHDAAIAANVEMPGPQVPAEFGLLDAGRFIAHVRDGVLVDVTRAVVLQAAP